MAERGEVLDKLAPESTIVAMMDLEPRFLTRGEAQPTAVTGSTERLGGLD